MDRRAAAGRQLSRSEDRLMEEHPIQQPIREIDVHLSDEGSTFYRVGKDGVTRIEARQKSGLHANLPYVRVWKGDVCEAEFCQHNIVGVYFAPPVPKLTAAEVARWKERGVANIVNGTCTSCDLSAAECACLPF
jgi:hypothetical protein